MTIIFGRVFYLLDTPLRSRSSICDQRAPLVRPESLREQSSSLQRDTDASSCLPLRRKL